MIIRAYDADQAREEEYKKKLQDEREGREQPEKEATVS